MSIYLPESTKDELRRVIAAIEFVCELEAKKEVTVERRSLMRAAFPEPAPDGHRWEITKRVTEPLRRAGLIEMGSREVRRTGEVVTLIVEWTVRPPTRPVEELLSELTGGSSNGDDRTPSQQPERKGRHVL